MPPLEQPGRGCSPVDMKAAVVELGEAPAKRCDTASLLPIQSSPAAAFGVTEQEIQEGLSAEEVQEPARAGNGLSHCLGEKKNVAEKRSESRVWWPKALALTADYRHSGLRTRAGIFVAASRAGRGQRGWRVKP